MEDGINDNTNNENRRRRPIPIPIYDADRFIERPYLRKHELSKIRDNLDELVEIKTGLFDKPVENKAKIDMIEPKKNDKKDDFFIDSTPNIQVPTIVNQTLSDTKIETKPNIPITNFSTSNINIPTTPIPIADSKVKSESKIETKSEISSGFVTEIKKDEFKKDEIKKNEIKFGISNLENNQTQQIDDSKNNRIFNDNKQKNKIIKKKVIRRMNDETMEQFPQYNISPEERRRQRKAEIKEFAEEDETNKAIRKAADLSEHNKSELEKTRRDLEELKKTLAAESDKTKVELKTEFGNRFNELGGKFNEKISDVTGKIDKVTGKLEETCTGIECLKKDLTNVSKNLELTECPECNRNIVPQLSSFCPGCGAQIGGWTEDDGVTPIKGWKPNWKK